MKRNDVESVSTIIVNIGTILYWVLSAVTAVVLNLQPQPIVLPGFFELGPVYKLIFFTSVYLGYIQMLKKSWENQKRRGKDVEGTFARYIYGSTIKTKRPVVLIGFLITLGIIGVFIFTELIFLGFLIGFIGFVAFMAFIVDGNGATVIRRQYDDEYRKRWLKRIRNHLYQDGLTNTTDFEQLPDTTTDEVNWAIKTYFDLYEFEQDLIFLERTFRTTASSYDVCEIRFKHVSSQIEKVPATLPEQ